MAGPTPSEILELIGARLGDRYRVRTIIGAGGLSGVYEATDDETRATVAVKVLLAAYAKDDAARTRFDREIEVLTRLAHPNVVAASDHGMHRGRIFLVLERLFGQDLDGRIARGGALPVSEAYAVLEPVMRGIASAHAFGVLHRDLKPSNVFLAEQDGIIVPKVIDFGLSRFFDAKLRKKTKTVTEGSIGTPAYMPPEQLLAGAASDVRSDVWAMGALWFHALAGVPPYRGTPGQVVDAIAKGEPPRVERWAPRTPTRLGNAIERAMAHEPEERFRSMDAFLEAVLDAR